MKNLSKLTYFLFFLILSFSFIIYHLSFSIARASDDNPIPPRPIIPCDGIDDPEFNSLRPYQSHPCGKSSESFFCGNEITIVESKSAKADDCNPTKTVNWVNDKDYWIDMTDLELPILGNTQEVQNSQRANDAFNDAQKMNEYVSWYLNGVINRAEYGEGKNTATELVNFSGPINKLMPSMILEAQRIETIENAEPNIGANVGTEEEENTTESHNQIVVCSESNIPIIGNLLNLGKFSPTPCYKGDGSSARGFLGLGKEVERLKSWDGDLSVWNSVTNAIIDAILTVAVNISRDDIAKSIGDHWNKRIPPLPWSNMEGKPFESDILYRKAYNEWKGKTCVIIPVFDFLICFENIFVPNKYADLYTYVPLANTSDQKRAIPIETITIQPVGATQIVPGSQKWDILKDGLPLLYFAHSIEVKELSELLNKTYLSSTPSGKIDAKTSEINGYGRADPTQCRTLDVRTNEGDNLFPIGGEQGKKDIGVNVKFTVNELPLVDCKTETVFNEFTQQYEEKETGYYYGEVSIGIQTDPIKVPNADNIWKSTVSSETSTFRRIFPKVEKGAPVECIADIPGVSKVAYKPVEGTEKIGVKSLGTPEASYDPLNAKLHFPHLGSVYEYFLKGIQTALRPKGYGDPIPNGLYCEEGSTIACGELPELPKASGSCSLGGISPRIGSIPKSLKDIVEAAADTYKTPPNLILGALYGEGAFNSAKGNSTGQGYDWTEENVLDWASCGTIPSCSGPETTLVNLHSWDEISDNIADDLKELDPNRTNPNPCNLLDVIYGISWTLSRSATGASAFTGHSCFGIPLNTGQSINTAGTCSWDARDYETAIRWWEFGPEYNSTYMCATLKNSCAMGGSGAANCPTGDDCETINSRYPGEESHNGCVWDVGHGI